MEQGFFSLMVEHSQTPSDPQSVSYNNWWYFLHTTKFRACLLCSHSWLIHTAHSCYMI